MPWLHALFQLGLGLQPTASCGNLARPSVYVVYLSIAQQQSNISIEERTHYSPKAASCCVALLCVRVYTHIVIYASFQQVQARHAQIPLIHLGVLYSSLISVPCEVTGILQSVKVDVVVLADTELQTLGA